MTGTSASETTALQFYLGIIKRQKWLVIGSMVGVTAVAVAYSLSKSPTYQSASQVVLERQNVAQQLSGINDRTNPNDFDRVAATQSRIASSTPLAKRVIARLQLPLTPKELQNKLDVTVL